VQLDRARDARELEAAARGSDAARIERRGSDGARIERLGRRVLISSGLEAAGRQYLLERLHEQRYDGLAALLRDRPEILERAEEQRREAR
jgi:hypothetical protein